ncbi:MAG: hypothetical protein ACWGQW_03140 [bacterium]
MYWIKRKVQNMIREQDVKLEQIEGLRLNSKLKETEKLAVLQALKAAVDVHKYSLEKILDSYCFARKRRR